MKNNIFLLLICIGAYSTARANNSDSTVAHSILKTVTVYKLGAELTHTTNAFLKQGNNELIIDDISNQLDINSVQITTGNAVTVMGIEFTNNYLKNTELSPRIKFLQDSIISLQKEIDENDLLISNDSDQLDLLDKNKEVKGTQNGLNVLTLMKLMDYYKAKSLELETAIARLSAKNDKAFADADKVQAQIEAEQKMNTATTGRLIVQLSAAVAGKQDFTISYITQNASWEPFYDVRVDNIKDPMKLIYKAKITQFTGIDWKQVKLSLSTSLPSQWNNAPELSPWFLSYVRPVAELDDVTTYSYSGFYKKEKRLAPMSVSDALQDKAAGVQVYDSLGNVSGLDPYVAVNNNTLDITFDVALPYDVPTNGKPQTAILQVLDVPATYQDISIPKLDKDPYLLAQIPDWGKLNLLPGEANMIVDNTYIGKAQIDPDISSDTLNMTLGRDKRVVVKREKITDYSSVKFLGSNKLQKFTYEITVHNTKKDSVDILLNDQFPISTDKSIVVELTDNGKADVNNETGLLSWKLKLAAGETKKLRFIYTIKYPKDQIVQ